MVGASEWWRVVLTMGRAGIGAPEAMSPSTGPLRHCASFGRHQMDIVNRGLDRSDRATRKGRLDPLAGGDEEPFSWVENSDGEEDREGIPSPVHLSHLSRD